MTRCIHLRRPPTVALQDGVFVPNGNLIEKVDHRWEATCASHPSLYDGRLCHVLGVHRNGYGGATIHVMDCAYRFFAVQDEEFDLGVRPLGVKGIVRVNNEFLMGKRSHAVAHYQGLWEFAPAGSVEPGRPPTDIIQQELNEETGLTAAHEPTAIAILFDPVLRCWEIVFRIDIESGQTPRQGDEYSQLEWRSIKNLPADLSPIAQQILAIIN